MELEEEIIKLTSKTFGKFCEKLAKVDPVAALVVTASAITPVMLGAMAVELLNQKEIYTAGGLPALNAHLKAGSLLPICQLKRYLPCRNGRE